MRYQSWYITGASSGIGEAFARLAPRDSRLLLSGRNEGRLEALAEELGRSRTQIARGDLTLTPDREVANLAGEEAKIDLLILNAGIGQFGAVLQNPPKREMEMMMLNMVAPVEAVRTLLPGMIERAKSTGRRAGIIFVASIAGMQPLPYLATYAASKSFLIQFGKSLATEIKEEPIDCLILCPGSTRTRFFERAGAKKPPGLFLASPERVAQDGLRYLGRKRIHVVGWENRLVSYVTRFIPDSILLPMAARITRQR